MVILKCETLILLKANLNKKWMNLRSHLKKEILQPSNLIRNEKKKIKPVMVKKQREL